MQFSIVIPTYNYGHLIERAVISACTQPGKDYEVIVVDDGSTDDTLAVLHKCQEGYKNLRIIHQKNAGASAARNRGVCEAQGSMVLFLDADDELLTNALSIFRKIIDECEGVEVVVGQTISVFGNGEERTSPVPSLSEEPEQRFLDYLYKKIRLSNGAVAIARHLLVDHPFNVSLRQTEDIPVFAHCLVKGRCSALAAAVVKIYKHDDSRRHGADAALSVGMGLVDEVFDPARLPASLMKHKPRYKARRALSLFRLLYRSGRFQEARRYYICAFKTNWRGALAKPEYFLKFIGTYFG